MRLLAGMFAAATLAGSSCGCTVKAVGDPNRPITINAHVTVDIRGLKNTASSIEDYVSGEASEDSLKKNMGK